MTPVEDLTLRLLDGEITDSQHEDLRRLLVADEEARQLHFALCQQEGLLRAATANCDVTASIMSRVRALQSDATGPPPVPPPVAPQSATVAPTPIVVDRGRSFRSRPSQTRRTRRSRPLFWIASTACLVLVAGALAVYLDLPALFQKRQVARVLPPEPAQIVSVGPGVRVQRMDQTLEASTGLELQAGDHICVPDRSWAALSYQDATRVLLHPSAEAVFQPPAGERAEAASKRLLLRQGILAAQVAKQSSGRSLELATANAAARVLGTQLLLTALPDQTQLDVTQGKVRLTRASDGTSVKTSAGYSAIAAPGTELVARRTADRVSHGLVSLYLFDEGRGTVVHDRAGSERPLDLYIADSDAASWIPGGGLMLHRATVVASNAPAAQIVQACRQSNELTIEAWIKPTSIEQVGPARIVSSSTDPYHRNFSLAQETSPTGADEGSAFLLSRLRSTGADLNGFPELRTAPGIVETDLMHVVYTRSTSGEAQLSVNGVARAWSVVPGDFSGWDDQYPLYLGNEGTMDRPWLGEYHLVAIYSRVLTNREVLQNYKSLPY